jgi:hypothetical protein
MRLGLSHHHAHLAGEAPNSLTNCLSIALDLPVASMECAARHEQRELSVAGTRPNALKWPFKILTQERGRMRELVASSLISPVDDIS